MDRFNIAPAEAISLGWDFSAELESGEIIVSSNPYGDTTVKLFSSSGEDITATNIEADSILTADAIVQGRVYGTEKGKTYVMKFYAATSTDNYRISTLTIRS